MLGGDLKGNMQTIESILGEIKTEAAEAALGEVVLKKVVPQWRNQKCSVLVTDSMVRGGIFPVCGRYAFIRSIVWQNGNRRNGLYHAYNIHTDLFDFSSDDFGEVVRWIEAKAT